jgi:hypothetical protein
VDRVAVVNQLAVVTGKLVEKSILLIELNEAVVECEFMVEKVVINESIMVLVPADWVVDESALSVLIELVSVMILVDSAALVTCKLVEKSNMVGLFRIESELSVLIEASSVDVETIKLVKGDKLVVTGIESAAVVIIVVVVIGPIVVVVMLGTKSFNFE